MIVNTHVLKLVHSRFDDEEPGNDAAYMENIVTLDVDETYSRVSCLTNVLFRVKCLHRFSLIFKPDSHLTRDVLL